MNRDNGSIHHSLQKQSGIFKALQKLAPIVLLFTLVAGAGGYLLGVKTSKTTPQGTQKISFQPSPTLFNTQSTRKGLDDSEDDEIAVISNTPSLEVWKFTYLVSMPDEMPLGAKLPIRVKMKNTSKTVQTVRASGTMTPRFVVARQNGTEVYRSKYIQLLYYQEIKVEPGEKLEIPAEWDRTDNDGKRVSQGIYIVQLYALTRKILIH
jgi:hypothetical protein